MGLTYFRFMRTRLVILLLLVTVSMSGQVLGGRSVYNFLRLAQTPQLTALGGVNISQPSSDIGMAFQNPALFTPAMNGQVNAVFNDFYGGINVFHLSGGLYREKLNTGFTGGLTFFNYGSTTQTDAAGNILGKFNPVDYVIQLGASRKWQEKWTYGLNLKFVQSAYGQYRSSGLGLDIGLLFNDMAKRITAAFKVSNLGFQLKKYAVLPEEFPFDMQAGISKRLENAPFSFSLTAQRLHQYDILYNDTAFNAANGFRNPSSGFNAGRLLDHLVIGTTIHMSDRLQLQAGYNFLRRRELSIANAGNGLNGFSVGAGVNLGYFCLRFARAYYQAANAYNQLGLNLPVQQYTGKWKKRNGNSNQLISL